MEFYKPENVDYVLDIVRSTEILYASMEIALDPDVHTYSGGLGVLAGDTLRSCADMNLHVTAMTLLYRKGYFKQILDNGWQYEADEPWDVDKYTAPLPEYETHITLDGRTIAVQPRLGIIVGHKKHLVPVLFLDTDLEANAAEDREITARLYGGNNHMRLKQEAVLGIAGKRIIRKLNMRNIHTFHMNEGHAAFAPMEDVRYLSRFYGYSKPLVEKLVKSAHVFTTHTPVPAGHDRFSYDMVRGVIGQDDFPWEHIGLGGHSELNMTRLALNLSRYANGVAKKHGEVSRRMFPGYDIDAITNGVHLPTWMCPHVQAVVDEYLPSWRFEPSILKHAYRVIPQEALSQAHGKSKAALIKFIKERTGKVLDPGILTVGFARRFATYKRADLLFKDIGKLVDLCKGKVQFVFAGEAHPNDTEGKHIIKRIHEVSWQLQGQVEIVFLEDYGMEIAQYLVSGCDLWLNNPVPPKEASGTSGMKAAANGVPNLSTLDGWWIEGITQNPWAGWIIEHREDGEDHISLYEQLGHIIRLYYDHKERWMDHQLAALSLAHYFNTHRMVQEYLDRAWTLKIY